MNQLTIVRAGAVTYAAMLKRRELNVAVILSLSVSLRLPAEGKWEGELKLF
jgi:hypothetical protein